MIHERTKNTSDLKLNKTIKEPKNKIKTIVIPHPETIHWLIISRLTKITVLVFRVKIPIICRSFTACLFYHINISYHYIFLWLTDLTKLDHKGDQGVMIHSDLCNLWYAFVTPDIITSWLDTPIITFSACYYNNFKEHFPGLSQIGRWLHLIHLANLSQDDRMWLTIKLCVEPKVFAWIDIYKKINATHGTIKI